MLSYTGGYIEHIDDKINDFKYYTFTPRPLMHGDMYTINDKLSALLSKAHRNIRFLEGLLKYAPKCQRGILHQSIILNRLIRQSDIRRFRLQI